VVGRGVPSGRENRPDATPHIVAAPLSEPLLIGGALQRRLSDAIERSKQRRGKLTLRIRRIVTRCRHQLAAS
jgi:hypothetical protein